MNKLTTMQLYDITTKKGITAVRMLPVTLTILSSNDVVALAYTVARKKK